MNTHTQKPTFTVVAIFIALAVVYAVLLFVANGLDSAFAQTVMVSLGSAIFGAGLVYFLIRLS